MASGGQMIKAQHFDAPPKAPPYVKDALRDIGLQEWVKSGDKKVSNPQVQRIVAKALGKDEWKGDTIATPWCAYYINAKLEWNNNRGTKNGMARSFLKWGTEVEEDDWQVGDIVVIWRGQYDDHVTGHVFFLLWWDENSLVGVGGNQGDKVCIQAFPRRKLLGVRRPKGLLVSKTIQAGGGSVTNELAVKPAVDAMLPNAPSAPPKSEIVVETLEQSKSVLETLAQYKPWIMGVLTAITVGLMLYAMYRRYQDHVSGQNT